MAKNSLVNKTNFNFMVSQSQTKPLFNFLVYIYVYDVSTCYSYIELWIERSFLGFSRYYFSSAKKKKCENHTLKSKNWWVCYVVYFSNSFFCLSEGRQLGPIQVWFSSYSSYLSFCCSAPHVEAKGRVINQHFCAKPYNVVTLTDEYLLVFYFLVHLPNQS